MKIAAAQVEARRNQIILTPLKKSSDIWGQEYAKGEVAGIELFTKITSIEIDSLEDEIQEALKKETGNADSQDDSTGT